MVVRVGQRQEAAPTAEDHMVGWPAAWAWCGCLNSHPSCMAVWLFHATRDAAGTQHPLTPKLEEAEIVLALLHEPGQAPTHAHAQGLPAWACHESDKWWQSATGREPQAMPHACVQRQEGGREGEHILALTPPMRPAQTWPSAGRQGA